MRLRATASLSALILCVTVTSPALAQDQVRSWTDRISFTGEAEFEAILTKGGGDDDSEADLPSFELGVDAVLSESLDAYLVLAADGPYHGIELDEGGVVIRFGPGSLNLGKQDVPFGNYESQMVSDPLTRELGETKEKAATLGIEVGPVVASAFLFNGSVDERGEANSVDNFGFSLGLAGETGVFGFEVGASYIDSLADSDELEENFEEGIAEKVEGVGVYVIASIRPVIFVAEYIAATDPVAFDASSAEPEAWSLELGYDFEATGKPLNIAVGVQGTGDAAVLGLPESRVLLTLSGEVMPSLTLSFEYANEADYSETGRGSGGDMDVYTLQLTLEF